MAKPKMIARISSPIFCCQFQRIIYLFIYLEVTISVEREE